jgi:lipopolysaccharide biosynthesis regulator YciM
MGFVVAQDTAFFDTKKLAINHTSEEAKKNSPAQLKSELKLALEKNPNDVNVMLLLGNAYTANNDLDSARYQYNQVLAKENQYIAAYLELCKLEYAQKNYDRVAEHASQGLLYYPNAAELIIMKAKALVALKDKKKALAFLKSYVDNQSNLESVNNYYLQLQGTRK